MNKQEPIESYNISAIHRNGSFKHFGISEVTVSLYGCKVDDIISTEITLSKDQTIPGHNEDVINDDYWAWFDFEDKKFSMIHHSRFQLDMCFPCGIESSEDAGKGKSYRIKVAKCVHEFVYDEDGTGGALTMSIHRTPEGAQIAIDRHRMKVKKEWDELWDEHNKEPDFNWDHRHYWGSRLTKIQD